MRTRKRKIFLMSLAVPGPPPYVYSTEYQDVLDYATTKSFGLPPTQEDRIADDELAIESVSNGLRAQSPSFFNFHTKGSQEYSCIDWKNLSDAALAERVNSPTYGTKAGFTGNGASSYLIPAFIPSVSGGLLTLNDMGCFAYSPSTNSSTGYLYGGTGGAGQWGLVPLNGANAGYVANDNTLNNVANAFGAAGNWHVRRYNGPNRKHCIINGNIIGNALSTAAAIPAVPMYCLAFNNSGTPANFRAARIDCIIWYKQSVISTAVIDTMWTNHRNRIAALAA